MAEPGDVIEVPSLGVTIEFRTTSDELLEFDVVGRPRGFITQAHVHPGQTERHEVIEGRMRIRTGGVTRILGPGDAFETPAGRPHTHAAPDDATGRVRVQIRPAKRTAEWLERLGAMDAAGELGKGGWPKPVPGARLIRDFAGEAHAAFPPPRAQQHVARAILAAHRRFDNEYVFIDEWDVDAPIDAVFAALSDASTYPQWWRPVHLSVTSDDRTATQRFRGRLPYTLTTRATTTRHEPPTLHAVEVTGDLRGRGTWTLRPLATGTHVRFDWHVFADRPLLRTLTPLLRPAFRWNHAWAIARAREGLEPYARRDRAPLR
jgi:quercetin dioxygenase-like cupin family protein